MISVSNEYKRQLIAGNRRWKIKVPVFLASNQTQTPDFTLTNNEIWEQGIVIDQATSDDSSFDLGSVIVGSLKVIINNINGHYSTYDFYNAKLVLWLGVEGDVDEHDEQVFYRIGFYSVDTPSYNGSLITLDCLDNMTWFDAPFSEVTGITYPTTAGQLVADICSHVGVTLGTVTFPNYTTPITIEPENELNCREVLHYIAEMCCCYCKINTAGELVLAWYDKNAIIGLTDYDGGSFLTNTTPYSDGCDLDGGSFDPWNTGDSADGGTFTDLMSGAYLTQNYQMEVSTDSIVVTGCRVRNTASNEDVYDELWVDSTLEQDHERYVLVIENNPFIDGSNASTIANTVGSILAGLPIRAFSATSLADFSYETGDMVTIYDFRGNFYRTWITHFVFTTNNSEQFSCGAESLRSRSEERYSTQAQTLQNASVLLSNYDKAVQSMNDLAQQALGYNQYVNKYNGAIITWLYNGQNIDTTTPSSPTFSDSTVVFKITGDGVFISHDGGLNYDSGYDANSGTAILSLLYAVGVSCDWVRTGTLTLGGYDNVDGKLIAYANQNVTGGSGTYSGSNIWIPIGYSQISQIAEVPIDIIISNISDPDDYDGWYQLNYTTDGGSTWSILERTSLANGHNIVATKLNIENDASHYYNLCIYEASPHAATFDYLITANTVVTTIDKDGVKTTNGEFSGSIKGATITGGSITTRYNDSTANGYTQISGGSIIVYDTANNFLHVTSRDYPSTYSVALGSTNMAVTCMDGTMGLGYIQRPTAYFGWALEDAYNSHSSDKKLKKNIKDIPIQESRDVILCARPRYYEFKETLEGGVRSGFVAQEFRKELDKIGNKSAIERQSFRRPEEREVIYEDFIAHLVNTTQDLYAEIDDLKAQIAELKGKE